MINTNYGEIIAKLLKQGDYKLETTVVRKSIETNQKIIDYTWKEALKSLIDNNIISDKENTYLVSVSIKDNEADFAKLGNLIIEELWKFVKDEDVVRVDIVKLPTYNDKPKSWLLVRD